MLQEHYFQKAKGFLKTVVCIDDEPVDGLSAEPMSKTAKRAVSGFGDEEPPVVASRSAETGVVVKIEQSHSLDFNATASAFANEGILCSVMNPECKGDELVERIGKLADLADVVILDWELERSDQAGKGIRSSEACRKAIKQIIEKDQQADGRLRLIVIYTGTDGALAIGDLAKDLSKLVTSRDTDRALNGVHWRVVVFQKSTPITKANMVAYRDLPHAVVTEFSKLTDGLLPTAVLQGITAIRENTHRLLSIFDRDLDGAFLTHRALIPDPDDAEEYLLELIQDELGALIRRNGFRDCVGASVCMKWIVSNNILGGEEAKRTCLETALSTANKNKSNGFIKDLLPKSGGDKKNKEASARDIADAVLAAFHSPAPEKAETGKRRLAKLTNFYGTGIPANVGDLWLRLGVLVWEEKESRYLMCLQPYCDSVRVKKKALFPFLILDPIPAEDKKMSRDLIVHSLDGSDVWLQADPSPKKLVSFKFDPALDDGTSPVGAVEESGEKVFMALEGQESHRLTWIGDVKLGKAQRIASGLAARFHTLGIDEFEWQRIYQRPDAK